MYVLCGIIHFCNWYKFPFFFFFLQAAAENPTSCLILLDCELMESSRLQCIVLHAEQNREEKKVIKTNYRNVIISYNSLKRLQELLLQYSTLYQRLIFFSAYARFLKMCCTGLSMVAPISCLTTYWTERSCGFSRQDKKVILKWFCKDCV